jgi:hypothetical protein
LIEHIRNIVKASAIEQTAAIVRAINNSEAAITRQLEKIMATFDEAMTILMDAVTAQKTQIDSLVTLTNGLHDQVIAALGGSLTPSQQQRVDAVFKGVTDNAAEVTAAINADTIQSTAGAVSSGPSAADIKAGAEGQPAAPAAPADASAPAAPPANP